MQGCGRLLDLGDETLKVLRKCTRKRWFDLPRRDGLYQLCKMITKCWFSCYDLCNQFIHPKRRFWKTEQASGSVFFRCTFQCLGYDPLKTASKTHSEMLVRPSKLFVWDENSISMWHVLGFLLCYYLLQQLCKMMTKDSKNMWWDAMIFCNNFARWWQKMVAFMALRCDVLILLGYYDLFL